MADHGELGADNAGRGIPRLYGAIDRGAGIQWDALAIPGRSPEDLFAATFAVRPRHRLIASDVSFDRFLISY